MLTTLHPGADTGGGRQDLRTPLTDSGGGRKSGFNFKPILILFYGLL